MDHQDKRSDVRLNLETCWIQGRVGNDSEASGWGNSEDYVAIHQIESYLGKLAGWVDRWMSIWVDGWVDRQADG